MKKILVVVTAISMIFGFGTVAMAGYDVQTAITSEDITGQENTCEKYGAITFTFGARTRVYDGDWFYFDLPRGVVLCQSFDFIVLGAQQTGVTPSVGITKGVPGTGVATQFPNATHVGGWKSVLLTDGSQQDIGPWKLKDLGTDNLDTGGVFVSGANSMVLRVSGTAGQRRVNFKWYDDEAVAPVGISNAANANGNTYIEVNEDTTLTLTLFDGEEWNAVVNPGGTIKNPVPMLTMCLKDTDSATEAGYDFFGEDAEDLLQLTTGNPWDNYICAKIPDINNYTGGDYINVSFDSGGISGDDYITFQGQREIAHIIGATAITLEGCDPKIDLCGYVPLGLQQGATCLYYYTSPAAYGYCTDTGDQHFYNVAGGIQGNKVIIKTSGTFGGASDRWAVALKIISGDGTYFAADPLGVDGLAPTNTANQCDFIIGTSAATQRPAGLAWTRVTRSGATFGGYGNGVGCGDPGLGAQVVTLMSNYVGPFDQSNRLMVDIPRTAFNAGLLANGDIATVQIELYKYPCGLIFTGTRCIANYVTTCGAAQPTTTLLFPYAVSLDGSDGWWYGLSVACPGTNVYDGSDIAVVENSEGGTVTFNVYEDDGDVSTYTTGVIQPGGMVTLIGGDLVSNLTLVTGSNGDGVIGNSRCHIQAYCNFGWAGGFGMMGNGQDSTGYTAYTTSNTWNN